MKKAKKIFALVSAVLTTFSCCISSFATDTEYFSDDAWLTKISETQKVVESTTGEIYVCDFEETLLSSIKAYKIRHNYGLVIEAEEGITQEMLETEYDLIKQLKEKYKFGASDYIFVDGCLGVPVASKEANSFIFYTSFPDIIDETNVTDETIEELLKYADELKNTNGITRAEVFRATACYLTYFEDVGENNVCIYLHNDDGTLDIDKLNSDVQLQEYLKSIGADPEIKVSTDLIYDHECFVISGIDDREKFIEIRDKLNTFDIINNKAFVNYHQQLGASTEFAGISYVSGTISEEEQPTIELPFVTTQTTTTSLSELTTTTVTTITTPQPTEQPKPLGDADGDNELTVRDCSFIAITIAQGRNDELSDSADYNGDNKVNVRDAAAIAKDLAVK